MHTLTPARAPEGHVRASLEALNAAQRGAPGPFATERAPGPVANGCKRARGPRCSATPAPAAPEDPRAPALTLQTLLLQPGSPALRHDGGGEHERQQRRARLASVRSGPKLTRTRTRTAVREAAAGVSARARRRLRVRRVRRVRGAGPKPGRSGEARVRGPRWGREDRNAHARLGRDFPGTGLTWLGRGRAPEWAESRLVGTG